MVHVTLNPNILMSSLQNTNIRVLPIIHSLHYQQEQVGVMNDGYCDCQVDLAIQGQEDYGNHASEMVDGAIWIHLVGVDAQSKRQKLVTIAVRAGEVITDVEHITLCCAQSWVIKLKNIDI